MQLTSDVVKNYGVANPFDPEANLMAAGLLAPIACSSPPPGSGCRTGLAAYNKGEGRLSSGTAVCRRIVKRRSTCGRSWP